MVMDKRTPQPVAWYELRSLIAREHGTESSTFSLAVRPRADFVCAASCFHARVLIFAGMQHFPATLRPASFDWER